MWTGISIALGALALAISLVGLGFAVAAVRELREFADRDPSYVASQLESLKRSHAELVETVEALANRYKMQKVRNVVEHGASRKAAGDLPDPHTDPDGWRSAMNSKLARERFNIR